MDHRKLNGLITGVAVVFIGVIIAAIFYGPDASSGDNDLTPGFVDTANEQATPHTGVGGLPAETPETHDEQWTQVGYVTDASTGAPLEGVSVIANEDGIAEVATTTNEDGWFELTGVPSSATLIFSLDGYHTVDQRVAPDREHNVALQSNVLTGRVVNSTGSPIQGATVASGGNYTRTVENGIFHLDDSGSGGDIVVKAAGFETIVIPRSDFARGFILEPSTINGIYASAATIADEERFTELLDMIERTDLNAIVIDIKDSNGQVHHASQVSLAQDIGAVQETFDAETVIEQLRERGIHAIARIVVFDDPMLATERPDLAIQDSVTGDPWETWQGHAWANPYNADVWDYNIALMNEAVALGFDEVQFSSVQFPSKGPLSRADFGQADSPADRQQAINDFLARAYGEIGPTPASLSSDISAMTLWDVSDDTLGQHLITMTERVDYIQPLIFPSLFEEGSIGLDVPGDHPWFMVIRSLESGIDHLPAHLTRRVRPWLQAFSYGAPLIEYGEFEVREQINGAEDFGVNSWMLWNPDSRYPEGALVPGE